MGRQRMHPNVPTTSTSINRIENHLVYRSRVSDDYLAGIALRSPSSLRSRPERTPSSARSVCCSTIRCREVYFPLEGFSPTGVRMPVPFAQWHAADTTLAAVDTAGLLHPRGAGRVAILGSAGGWRADTLEVEVAAGRFATVLGETWEERLEANWVLFGIPRPAVDSVSGRRQVLLDPRRQLRRQLSSGACDRQRARRC